MRNYFLFFFLLLFFNSCQKEVKNNIDTSNIEVEFMINRFEQDFYTNKGDNLEEALLTIVERVDRLNNIVSALLMGLQTLTQTVMEPRVGGNAGGPVTATLTAGMANCIKFMTDLQRYSGDLNIQRQAISALKIDYLNDMGAKYINSRHNRTN